MRDDATLTPMFMYLLAIALLSAMDAVVKQLAPDFATWQIVLLRYVFGTAFALPFFFWRWPGWPDRATVAQAAIRSASSLVTIWCFFVALALIPLAKLVALTFSAPLILVLLARVFLGEPVTKRALLAIMIGLIGVVIMLWRQLFLGEGGADDTYGVTLALLASVSYSTGIILTRMHGQKQSAVNMIAFQNIITCVVALPLGLSVWQPLSGASDLGLFIAIGAMGAVGQYLIVTSFSRANAARLGPLEYTALLWASLLGYVFFNEVPSRETIFGAGLIVVAAVLVVRRPRIAAMPRAAR